MLQREETSFVRKTKIYFYYIFFIYKIYKYIRKLGYFLGWSKTEISHKRHNNKLEGIGTCLISCFLTYYSITVVR